MHKAAGRAGAGLPPGPRRSRRYAASWSGSAREHDRWDDVCDIYLGAIDEFAPADQSVSIHYEVARLREALGQVSKAEERYQAIVALKPEETRALDRLEEITREQGRCRRSGPDPRAAHGRNCRATESGPVRRAKLAELAHLYEQQLEKPYEAIDTLELMVSESFEEGTSSDESARVETIAACDSLARLYGRVGMWNKVIEALQRQADLTTDPATVRSIRMRVAEVYERELGQSARAIEAFEAVPRRRSRQPRGAGGARPPVRGQGRWDELQQTLAHRAEISSGLGPNPPSPMRAGASVSSATTWS